MAWNADREGPGQNRLGVCARAAGTHRGPKYEDGDSTDMTGITTSFANHNVPP